MPFYPAQIVQVSPSNPSGTTSTTLIMMGLGVAGAGGGWSFTPRGSGNVLLVASGAISNNTTADGAAAQLSYGTGAAPANAAALAGTQIGTLPVFTALTGLLTVPFSLQAIATGLTLGTTYWFDLALKAVTAGTASVATVSCTAFEI
jgi:hypothetical protein